MFYQNVACDFEVKEAISISKPEHIDIYVEGVSGAELQSYCQTIVGSGKARYTYYITGQASHIDTGSME